MQPFYNHWKWEEEALSQSKLVESISEYKRKSSPTRGRSQSPRLGGAGSLALNGGGLEMGSFGSSAYSGTGAGAGAGAGVPTMLGPGGVPMPMMAMPGGYAVPLQYGMIPQGGVGVPMSAGSNGSGLAPPSYGVPSYAPSPAPYSSSAGGVGSAAGFGSISMGPAPSFPSQSSLQRN